MAWMGQGESDKRATILRLEFRARPRNSFQSRGIQNFYEVHLRSEFLEGGSVDTN